MRRLRVRNKTSSTNPAYPAGAVVAFKDIPIGGMFCLTKENTKRMVWLKTVSYGAQYIDWDNDTDIIDQEFPPEYPVFPFQSQTT